MKNPKPILVFSGEELGSRALRHERAIEMLSESGLFQSKDELCLFADLLAQRQAGKPIIKSQRAWMEKTEEMLAVRADYEAAKSAAVQQAQGVEDLEAAVADVAARIAAVQDKRDRLNRETLPFLEKSVHQGLELSDQPVNTTVDLLGRLRTSEMLIKEIDLRYLPALERKKAEAEKSLADFLKRHGVAT